MERREGGKDVGLGGAWLGVDFRGLFTSSGVFDLSVESCLTSSLRCDSDIRLSWDKILTWDLFFPSLLINKIRQNTWSIENKGGSGPWKGPLSSEYFHDLEH